MSETERALRAKVGEMWRDPTFRLPLADFLDDDGRPEEAVLERERAKEIKTLLAETWNLIPMRLDSDAEEIPSPPTGTYSTRLVGDDLSRWPGVEAGDFLSNYYRAGLLFAVNPKVETGTVLGPINCVGSMTFRKVIITRITTRVRNGHRTCEVIASPLVKLVNGTLLMERREEPANV